MSKVALGGAIGLLLLFTYLTGIRPAYAFTYALALLFVVTWVWPRVALRGMTVSRRLDPGTPTVGEAFEEAFEAGADYPPETGGVREDATGDSFGRIHWPLSARHQRLMSKTFEQPLTTDLWILLDLDRAVHVGEGEESTLEYAVSLAASMASQVHSRGRQVGLIANDSKGTILEPHRAVRQDRLIPAYLAVAQADGRTPLTQTLAWDKIRRLPPRAIAVLTPSAHPAWVPLLQSVRGRRSTRLRFYLDVGSFGGPDQNPSFDLGQDVDLYVVRRGDDFARLVRTRDAIRIA